MHISWITEAFLVCDLASIRCYLCCITEAFPLCVLICRCVMRLVDHRSFLGKCSVLCTTDTYSQEQAYMYAV